MKMRMMNNKVKKQEAMKSLMYEFDSLQKQAKSKYNDRVYMNLPVTRLERVFFRLMAERMEIDKTKLLRRIIRRFIQKYPSIVEEAKCIVDDDLDVGDK